MGILILVFVVLAVGIWVGFIIGFSRAIREAARQMTSGSSWPDWAQFLIGFGCLFLTLSVVATVYSLNFIRTAKKTTGTVVEMRQRKEKETEGVSYAPTFSFKDATGAAHTVSAELFSSPPMHQVGDTVGILYRPGNPQNASIDGFWYHWALATILACVGSVITILGVVILYWTRIVSKLRERLAKTINP